MLGERLRQTRVSRQLSLADVASAANVSAATLSRIERDRQALDMAMVFTLSRVLDVTPSEIVGGGDAESGSDGLAKHIAAMATSERTKLWRHLNERRHEQRARMRTGRRATEAEVEELLAQMDLLRQEIEAVCVGLRKKR